MERHHPGGIGTRVAGRGRKDEDCRQGCWRSDKMERPWNATILVASEHVWWEEEEKTAGKDASGPME